MPNPKKDQPSDAPKPKAVRRSGDAPIADTAAKPARRGPGPAEDTRIPPPNARVIKYAPVKGTGSRAAARAAVKRVKATGTEGHRSDGAPIADTPRSGKSPNGATGTKSPRTPPPNARVIQDSHKTGTVSRAAARAAAKRASGIV